MVSGFVLVWFLPSARNERYFFGYSPGMIRSEFCFDSSSELNQTVQLYTSV